MNMPLYGQMLKNHLRTMINYAFGSAFYILLMFWIYPNMATQSETMNELITSMPEGLSRAFGLENGFGTIDSFISGEYYGLLFMLILSIFSIMTSTQLMARLVDQGSMAYLLSAPTTRVKVALTQAVVLLTGLLVIVAVTTLAGYGGYAWFIGNLSDFDSKGFLQLNLGALLLFFAICGISFFISAVLNDEKRALGISGAIVFVFFSLNLVGKISDKLAWMKHISLFSLFNTADIVKGTVHWAPVVLILLGVGIAGFSAGIMMFRKRSLPL
ncbi:ABC transporter permease subunit [Paenibacillus sp.]|jgi:ABC-2 type transport system permease protein|uniref:ABC transporter permease subunit n=1 Tax=Paenibacillus sp. TaxID=58172 RepID=UPI00281BC29E|nr:ABC transporter permease subunit [Paenibacillus sp.]MDR0268420.1 ABC transporter permease [Paenibacillus sp.]